jgi:hypothetical protein
MVGVTVVAWAVWWLGRRTRKTGDTAGSLGRWFIPLAIVGLVVSVGAGVSVVRIGDSGAKAVWSQTGQTTPDGGGQGEGDD